MKILLNLNQHTNEKLDHELSKISDLESKKHVKSKTALINYLLDKALREFDLDDYLAGLESFKYKYHLNYKKFRLKFKNKEIRK